MSFWNKNRKGSSAKMGNRRTELGGYSFSSKLEAAGYQMLKSQEEAGEIVIEQVQAHVYLTDARILYIPDFKCIRVESNIPFFVEMKGFETSEWRIKRRLWQYYGPGELHVYKGDYRRPKLSEVIVPKMKEEKGE